MAALDEETRHSRATQRWRQVATRRRRRLAMRRLGQEAGPRPATGRGQLWLQTTQAAAAQRRLSSGGLTAREATATLPQRRPLDGQGDS